MKGKRVREIGEGSSNTTADSGEDEMLFCYCNKPARLLKSWTNENPGRRFYRCQGFKSRQSCNFFVWHDGEAVGGWAKNALIAARDEIREKKAEILFLMERIKALEEENETVRQINGTGIRNELRSMESDIQRWKEERSVLQSENVKLKKRCKGLKIRNKNLHVLLMVVSCVFFFICSTMCVYFGLKL